MTASSDDIQNDDYAITRLIIIHKGLLPSKGLDEGASIDELSEYILYYFDEKDQHTHGALNSNGTCVYNEEDAIRFAGLCSALCFFPTSFGERDTPSCNEGGGHELNREDVNYVKEVELSTCTLIFIPLETNIEQVNHNLVAIAQCPKPTNGSPLSPAIIRRKINISHQLYQLIKYGGIHNSLQSFDQTNLQYFSASANIEHVSELLNPYPGMSDLYHTHKMLRKLHEQQVELPTNSDISIKMHESQKRLNELNYALPIGYIRRDLKLFYDWILGEYNSTQSREYDVFKIIMPPSKVKFQSSAESSEDNKRNNFINEIERELLQKINPQLHHQLHASSSTASSEFPLHPFQNFLGFSIFDENNNLCCTHMKSNNTMETSICTTRVQMLHKYFTSHTSDIKLQHTNNFHTQQKHEQNYQQRGFYIHDPTCIQTTANGTTASNHNTNNNSNQPTIWIIPIHLANGIILYSALYRQLGIMDIIIYSAFDATSQVPFLHTLTGLSQFVNTQVYKVSSAEKGNKTSSTGKKHHDIDEDKVIIVDLVEKDLSLVFKNLLRSEGEDGKLHCLFIDRSRDLCHLLTNRIDDKRMQKKSNASFHFTWPLSWIFDDKKTKSGSSSRLHALSIQDVPKNVVSSLLNLANEIGDETHESSEGSDFQEMLHVKNNGNGWSFGCIYGTRELYLLCEEGRNDEEERRKYIPSIRHILRNVETLSTELTSSFDD